MQAKVVGKRRERIEKKNHIVGIHYELFDMYIYTHTLHIEEVDINKKSNVSWIGFLNYYDKVQNSLPMVL